MRGGTVFVFEEQGFGDNFMFAKLVPLLLKWCDRIVLCVYPALVNVLVALGVAVSVGGSKPARV